MRTVTARLRALILAVDDDSVAESVDGLSRMPCVFCGTCSGKWQLACTTDDDGSASYAACPLCALARHLERPRIDDEVRLIWLPEMSQQAVNTIIRAIHLQLRDLGESLGADDPLRGVTFPEQRALCCARAALAGQSAAAAGRLGTSQPSEVASALRRLSPAAYRNRGALLGGLRLLPLGRLFEADRDVYPAIVDTWRNLAKPSAALAPTRVTVA